MSILLYALGNLERRKTIQEKENELSNRQLNIYCLVDMSAESIMNS